MVTKGFGTVLSSRVFLTLACTGLLLLVPGVLAGSEPGNPMEDPGTPPSFEEPPSAEEAYASARATLDEQVGTVQGELSDQGVEPEDPRREVSRTLRSLQGEADALANELGVFALARELEERVDGADELLPYSTVFGEAPEQETQDVEVQSGSTANSWSMDAKPFVVLAGTAAAAGLMFWLAGSSGTLGAGTAAAQQAAGRRFLPYASPLFTRFEKDTVLDHPKREGLYGMIVMKPGITLQDLCEGTGLSRTAVSHHLRLMEQQHIIVSKRVGRSRHFFENGGRYGRDQKDAYAVLHNDRSKEVHSYIETHPGAIQKDLCSALGIQASVAHWHVKRLEEANLIEAIRRGRTVSYFPSQTLRPLVA